LHELGLVMLIAITYVPETMRQFQRIRDAQAIRGQQIDGLRAWRPIIIPLLIAGLERALNLSETMVARGYGATNQTGVPRRARLMLFIGLGLALVGALCLAWGATDGWLIVILGVLAVILAYRELNRLVAHTRYRPRHWNLYDSLVVMGALLTMLPLLPLPGLGRSPLAFSPYPTLSIPAFNLWIGGSLFGLVLPAIVANMNNPVLEAAG